MIANLLRICNNLPNICASSTYLQLIYTKERIIFYFITHSPLLPSLITNFYICVCMQCTENSNKVVLFCKRVQREKFDKCAPRGIRLLSNSLKFEHFLCSLTLYIQRNTHKPYEKRMVQKLNIKKKIPYSFNAH